MVFAALKMHWVKISIISNYYTYLTILAFIIYNIFSVEKYILQKTVMYILYLLYLAYSTMKVLFKPNELIKIYRITSEIDYIIIMTT